MYMCDHHTDEVTEYYSFFRILSYSSSCCVYLPLKGHLYPGELCSLVLLFFLKFHIKSYNFVPFWVWLLLLLVSVTACVVIICSLSLLNSTVLYDDSIIYLIVWWFCNLADPSTVVIWVSDLGLLCLMMLWTFFYMSVGTHIYTFVRV